MPDLAHVQASSLRCPTCLADLSRDKLVGFQWGFCAGVMAVPNYQIGDPVLWRVGKDRIAAPWTYFKSGGGNIGDPNYFNVLIRESGYYDTRACRKCNFSFRGIGIRIEAGIIIDVSVFEKDLPETEISIVMEDGTIRPKPEWDDHPMPLINAGLGSRLIPQPQLRPDNNGNITKC